MDTWNAVPLNNERREGSVRNRRSLGGCSPPNPSASIPSGKGVTPEGNDKKCETPLDSEQPLHGSGTCVLGRHLEPSDEGLVDLIGMVLDINSRSTGYNEGWFVRRTIARRHTL